MEKIANPKPTPANASRDDPVGMANRVAGERDETAPDDHTLSRRVMRGTAWIVAARFIMRVIGFVNTIIVAKLLVPEDFGLIAVGVAAMQLVQGFSNIGLSQAVVKFRDATRDDFNTLFTLSALRGLLTALILAVSGVVAARVFADPRFIGVFLGVALTSFLLGLMNPRFYEFERDLDFSREFLVTVSEKTVSVLVTISIALILRSYWALIIGMIAGALTQMIMSYGARPFLPRLSLASFKRMIGFSGWLAGVSFVVSLNNKLDSFFLARLIGLPATGIYYLGSQLAGLVTSEMAEPLARAIYPGLSQLERDGDRMRRAFLGGVAAVAAIALPTAFGVAFVAGDLVAVVFGTKWAQTVPVLTYLTPAFGVQALMLSTYYYAMARGRVRLAFFRELAFLLIKTPLFIWAAATHGFLGAVYMAAGTCLIYTVLQLILYRQISGGRLTDPLWAARRSIGAVAVMALWFLAVPAFRDMSGLAPVIRLLINVPMGALFYIAAHATLWKIEGCPDGVEAQLVATMWQGRGSLAKKAGRTIDT
ncbi:MAG: lipopolysaccharide biosynthesis protein [Pseudomonadota bacterium]